ncbi:N-acetylmuramoyl-L-alanine amidase [Streptomyces sp. NBC_01306]|uniref:peptidoglycan recognition protein family protein n=1 Tax=Streptomyces sp. NBC_01306 TaxID=2903819 RepID=UPI0022563A12|nr:N-acetylmuramoyl-L-alanine amidase [Streptomyces sp. NBC_01306]MCX4726201.1 N-acetylmuramoyl-L-alanine amidase [Streptomyces sp. NBC_01306]
MTASVLSASIAVACAAALALPTAAPAGAVTPRADSPATTFPGSTQSLRLNPVSADRSTDTSATAGLSRQKVKPFSLVGVVWSDKNARLNGTVQVRTRPVGSTAWTGWQSVEAQNDGHAPDPATAEAESSAVRGSTAPLWVGNSDAVQVRVRAKAPTGSTRAAEPLPKGLRLDLVDPGPDPKPKPKPQPADPTAADPTASGPTATEPTATDPTAADPTAADPTAADPTAADPTAADPTAADPTAARPHTAGSKTATQPDPTELPALSKEATVAELESTGAKAGPYVAPRPRIVTRQGWGADESVRESGFSYTDTVKVAFVHHTATGNNYTCEQAPALLRSMYRYHVKSLGWRDIGYNFAIDKCGTIYEGRAGGVTKPVMGAHTLGFNADSTGVAVIGTFTSTEPSAAAVTALSRFTAWKLGLTGADPEGKATLVSDGGNRYDKGTEAELNVISGHRDGFATECPGAKLYDKLGEIRTAAARYQGR